MKKIYTKSVFEFNKNTRQYQLNENESQFYLAPDDAPMMQMKGADSSSTAPWGTQKPFLKRGFGAAEDAFLNSPDFSPESKEFQDMILNQARGGAGNAADANDLQRRTIGGEFLTGGKGFDAAVEAAKGKILPTVNSAFEKSGRGGSGLADVAKTGAIGNVFASQYGQERQNQINAANQATTNNNTNMNAATAVGSARDNARRTAIMNFMKTIGGNYGQSKDEDEQMDQWLKTLLAGAGGAAQGFASGGVPGAVAGGAAGAAGSFA